MTDSRLNQNHLPPVPARPAAGHKGTFGRLLIVAGSRGMSGAAALAGIAALRGGAGLVTLAVPQSVQPVVAAIEPGYMTIGLSETRSGHLSETAFRETQPYLAGKQAVAAGPGLGTSSQVRGFVRQLWFESSATLILDADALNVLAGDFRSQRLSAAGSGTETALRVLTPHPGEFARLCGCSIAEIEQNRKSIARNFAQQHGVLLILKGPGTVITDGERLAVNPTGNSGMATGGSGDVLTGLLCALLARTGDPFDAARLAVWLHGRAGDLAAARSSEESLIASDLPSCFGQAWQELKL